MLMIAYKMVDESGLSFHSTGPEQIYPRWEIGCPVFVTSPRPKLCTSGVLHGYSDPLLAVFMAPAHGVAKPGARMFAVECEPIVDGGTKLGAYWMLPIAELVPPPMSRDWRTATGILCAVGVHNAAPFAQWAELWLSGRDRSSRAAANAADAACAACAVDAADAACAAANAAANAADAACAAANAATNAACAAGAARAAANAADAACAAANAAANAADAARPSGRIDVLGIIHKARAYA